jgi:hypothetical protein
MRKLWITFISLCLLSLSAGKTKQTPQAILSLPTKFRSDSAVLRSLLYQFENNQKKVLERQDSLNNLLN